jgi:DNA polymerase I-like protein with 3'-5' exonuclease and polymerase domains
MQIETLTFDFETSCFQKGNPFSQQNKAVCLALKLDTPEAELVRTHWEFDDVRIKNVFTKANLGIAFNAKFDLHWSRRVQLPLPSRIWDCQLAEFILENQTNPYPSLNDACEKYGIPVKLDIVKLEYWEKGIDTCDVPRTILQEYAEGDVERTYRVYLKQKEQFENEAKHKYTLFKMCCADLLVLAEMEWNGLLFDQSMAQERSLVGKEKLNELRYSILGDYSNLPINLGSGDHLSAFLYGGTIVDEIRVPNGVYKTGAKTGLPRYQIIRNKIDFPRQFLPLEKSELKKEGFFSTDEATLRSLKGTKEKKKVLEQLDEYAKLDKVCGTYYEGINKLITEMDWPANELHGQFNQVVARTGRLSASRPNTQNFGSDAKKLIYSRYE